MAAFSEVLNRFFYDPDEDVGEVFATAYDSGELSPPVPEETDQEYLAFQLDSECYAVPLTQVREIVKVPHLTEIPRAPENLLGVIKLRGEVLPVYDVKARLHLRPSPRQVAGEGKEVPPLPKSARILIFREQEGDVGVLADSVREVIRLGPSHIEPLAPGIASERDCLLGLGHLGDEMFILLDVRQVLG